MHMAYLTKRMAVHMSMDWTDKVMGEFSQTTR